MANPRVRRTRRHQRHREQVMRANTGMCHICGQGGADAIDHIVPVAWGGSDDISNLAPAHTSCNSSRGDAAPPAWTYTRPSMWLPGFGPRAPGGAPARGGRSGCLVWGGGITLGVVGGAFIGGALNLDSLLSLLIMIGLSWAFVSLFAGKWRRPKRSLGQVQVTGFDTGPINARGVLVDDGIQADANPDDEQLIEIPFTPLEKNFVVMAELLGLTPGSRGYRDGITQPAGSEVTVNAVARLLAHVEMSGDDEEAAAAPVGHIRSEDWRDYPRLGRDMFVVQVIFGLDETGQQVGWIRARPSRLRD
jgi:hypothetical protein